MNKNLKNQIQVSLSNLNTIQSILSKSKFELLEIWTPDEGNEKQIWFNKHSDTKITIIINSDKSDTDNEELISEVRDLWFELRAIRDVMEEYYLEPELDTKNKNINSFCRYLDQVREYQNEWEENKSYWSKLFNKNIDPSTLAFLNLDDEDKQNLTN